MPTTLLVHDSLFLRMSLKRVLEQGGWTAIDADDLDAALVLAGEARFDVIAMAASLGEKDPSRACDKLKQAAPGSTIVLITKAGEHELVRKGIEGGARDYVTRPFDDRTLDRFNKAVQ